jgi:hypothetical protein
MDEGFKTRLRHGACGEPEFLRHLTTMPSLATSHPRKAANGPSS